MSKDEEYKNVGEILSDYIKGVIPSLDDVVELVFLGIDRQIAYELNLQQDDCKVDNDK